MQCFRRQISTHVARTAIDVDAIKIIVEPALGIGLPINMAWIPERDKQPQTNADQLIKTGKTRIAIRMMNTCAVTLTTPSHDSPRIWTAMR